MDTDYAVENETSHAQSQPQTLNVGGVSGEELRLIIDKVENLEEQKHGISQDIKEVYADAKGRGYDVKIIRQLIRLRKMKQDDRAVQEEMLDLYKTAIGMIE